MPPSLDPGQEDIVREFQGLQDPMERYERLIALAREAPGLEAAARTRENLVPGCQAEVWLRATLRDGRVHFEADSPSLLVKGLAVLLTRALSDRTPPEVLGTELYFVERLGLQRQLSPTRSNGLAALVQAMRSFARANVGPEAGPVAGPNAARGGR